MSDNKLFWGVMGPCLFIVIGCLSSIVGKNQPVQTITLAHAAPPKPAPKDEPLLTVMFEGEPITYKQVDFDKSWENCKLVDQARANAQSELTSSWTDVDGKIDAARRLRKLNELAPARMLTLCQAIAEYKIQH